LVSALLHEFFSSLSWPGDIEKIDPGPIWRVDISSGV
jgi:hypothetical protein